MIVGFVHGQTLRLNASGIVADTINYLTARFTFRTSDWDALEVWAHFSKGEDTYDIRLDDGQITQDMRLNLSAGKWRLYLHGNRYADGAVIQRVTTEIKTFDVSPTGTLDGEPFPEIPASETERINARLEALEQGGTGKPGEPGFSPSASVEQTDTGAVITITDKDGTTTATVTNGKNGITPHIGENGNWWIGETDTGISAGGTVKSVNGNLPDENGNVVIDLPEGSGSDEVFVAEYGVTKFAELLEAYNAGKTLVMVDSDYGYWASLVLYDHDIFQFANARSVVVQMYSLHDDDSWTKTETRLAREDAIPTKTSDITNDSGFITRLVADLANYYTKSQTYTQAEINALVSAIPKFAISVVSALPTSGISETTVYLVKSGSDSDLYTEYIYVNGAWEILGSQKVDLTGYATETWVNTKLADYLPAAQLQTAINEALAQAKASGEFDGAPGTSPTVAVSAITGGHRITITDKDGTKTVDVMDGADGDPGDPGKNGDPGRGILSVTRTSGTGAAGTTDTYTITYTDNTTSTFGVYNGKDGDPYTLTSADKTAIAQEAAGLVDVPDVDNTLKVAGAAADAAKVGKELSSLSEAIAEQQTQLEAEISAREKDVAEIETALDNKQPIGDYATKQHVAEEIAKAQLGGSGGETTTETKTRTLTSDDFEAGLISADGSVNTSKTHRIYTPEFLECTEGEAYRVTNLTSSGNYFRVVYYDGEKNVLGAISERTTSIDGTQDIVSIADSLGGVSDISAIAYIQIGLWKTGDNSSGTDYSDYETKKTLVDTFTITRTYEETTTVGGVDTSQFVMQSDLKKAKEELETVLEGKQPVGDYATVARVAKETAIQKYDSNFVPNERFVRAIANMRDSENAKEFEIKITNNSGTTIKNAAIAVGLHNTVGVTPTNNNLPFQIYDNVFSAPTGFKFYDEDGSELPYYIESESDCNYIVDKNIYSIQKTMAVFSDGKIAVYNSDEHRVQITSDDGLTWTNICNEITKWPYRILLPDSQDNLFVASNDGYKLYKYTSADGYMSGTQVIDMESYETKIGSILAEDSDGNLYLGTYQDSPWRCTIRKSKDHGDTWEVVFDMTECQHVHNIYVNKKVTPNEIFIGLDSSQQSVRTYVSTDAGATWTQVDVPYGNRDNAFRYAGENFYIGCGERLYLGGATLYKTTDYNDPNAYYPLFDNAQGVRDVFNVLEESDDVLIAGGCVDAAVNTQQLFLSEDRGETWKTVLMNPYFQKQSNAGKGLRTFSRKGNEILSETATYYAMRFVYGNGAKTTLAVVAVGDIPAEGKTITLKTGYVANIEQMEKVLTSYETIDGKVADIRICDGYVIDAVSNKRVLTGKTEFVDSRIKIGQTSEYKILSAGAYRLTGSVNLGKLSRLNFTKGFTVSMLFRKEDKKSLNDYLSDSKYYVIFQTGDTKFMLQFKSLVLMSGDTNIFGKIPMENVHFLSVNEDYIRVTVYVTGDELPSANLYTETFPNANEKTSTDYPITENFSENDFIVGNALGSAYGEIPNIARIEIYNRVLTHGEIMALTVGCNLVTDGSEFN